MLLLEHLRINIRRLVIEEKLRYVKPYMALLRHEEEFVLYWQIASVTYGVM